MQISRFIGYVIIISKVAVGLPFQTAIGIIGGQFHGVVHKQRLHAVTRCVCRCTRGGYEFPSLAIGIIYNTKGCRIGIVANIRFPFCITVENNAVQICYGLSFFLCTDKFKESPVTDPLHDCAGIINSNGAVFLGTVFLDIRFDNRINHIDRSCCPCGKGKGKFFRTFCTGPEPACCQSPDIGIRLGRNNNVFLACNIRTGDTCQNTLITYINCNGSAKSYSYTPFTSFRSADPQCPCVADNKRSISRTDCNCLLAAFYCPTLGRIAVADICFCFSIYHIY